jgi:hypothetical protein
MADSRYKRCRFYTRRMAALWAGPEPVSADGSLAAVDPLQPFLRYHGDWLLMTYCVEKLCFRGR